MSTVMLVLGGVFVIWLAIVIVRRRIMNGKKVTIKLMLLYGYAVAGYNDTNNFEPSRKPDPMKIKEQFGLSGEQARFVKMLGVTYDRGVSSATSGGGYIETIKLQDMISYEALETFAATLNDDELGKLMKMLAEGKMPF